MNSLKHSRWLLLLAAIIAFDVSARAQDSQSGRELYENAELFNQLSGAGQNLMRLRFGPRPGERVEKPGKQEPISPVFDSRGGTAHLSAIANSLVNDAAADATAQDTQSETSIVLGSGTTVIAGFNDSGSYIGGASKFTGFSRSTNGGTSWVDGGTLPTSTNGDAGDPVLARNTTTGRIYLATLQFSGNGMAMFRSDDNGLTWMAPTQAAPGATGFQDKEWIVVDNFAGAGNGNVYHGYRDFATGGGMKFTRSTDNGATFTPSPGFVIATGGQGAWVTVGTDHAVYYHWLSGSSILQRKSTDQGVTFASATTVATLLTTGTNGDLGLTGFRSNAFPQVVVNPVSGHLYMTYNDNPAGADRGDVYFRHSTDGGATWSAQVRVNNDAGTNDNWQPAIAATPDGTGLFVGWYDRRNDPANNLIERWGVIGTISGSTITFGNNFKISPPFPVVVGVDPVINATYMGDYDQVVADNSFFYMTWGDNRDQSIAVPARKNANVRFAKIPVAGPGPIISASATAVTGGNGNGGVDPNECNDFAITLRNDGTSTATSVVGTISTTAPNVTLTTNNATYPNITVGGTANSTLPFKISTNLAYVCGTAIPITLVVTYTGGSDTIVVSAPVNGSGYTLTQSSGNSIVPGTTDIGNHGDDVTTNITLPFSYDFYDGTYTTVNVSSNGNLQFVSNSTAYANICLPSTALNYAIFPHWDDLRTDAAGRGIFTSTSGSTPNRIFNIEWRATLFSGGGAAKFQVRLYEGLRKLDIIYGDTVTNSGVGATAGIQQGTGASYSQFSCNTAALTPGLKLTYTQGVCTDGGGDCFAVPIQLARFTGRALSRNRVLLEWRTISEINNYGFEIQKATEESGPFATIAGSFVPGHGTTIEPHDYSWIDASASPALPYYRLKQIDLDGSVNYFDPIRVSMPTAVGEQSAPTEFALEQNYPNPFNPSTVIQFALPQNAMVTLDVFNAVGQRVATLVNERREAGYHQATFDGTDLASGVYVYKLHAGNFVATRKLLLVK
jgi:hypothetical protein